MDNDIVTLISRDGKDKVVCSKYMEECFQKEGYISSKKLYINLLYKLSNFEVLRKIKVFFTLCLRCKFFFEDPEHFGFVIFDKPEEAAKFINKNYNKLDSWWSKVLKDKIYNDFKKKYLPEKFQTRKFISEVLS